MSLHQASFNRLNDSLLARYKRPTPLLAPTPQHRIFAKSFAERSFPPMASIMTSFQYAVIAPSSWTRDDITTSPIKSRDVDTVVKVKFFKTLVHTSSG
jgi:hypothetical protein